MADTTAAAAAAEALDEDEEDDGTNRFNKDVARDVILDPVPTLAQGWLTVCSSLVLLLLGVALICSDVFRIGGGFVIRELGLGALVLDQLRSRYSDADKHILPVPFFCLFFYIE